MQLFVYGSLRKGGRHHEKLRGARLIEVCRTMPEYGLLERGPYPVLVPGAMSVPGELFEVNEALLVLLDEFEGKGYERALIRLEPTRPAEPPEETAPSLAPRLAWAYVGHAVEAVQTPRSR